MRVLFATDGSRCAEHAIAEGMRILPLERAQVTVVSVTDPTQRIGGNEDADEDLDRAQAILRAGGYEPAIIKVSSEPAAGILATAERLGVDLVVVGSHGRGAVARMVVGSVSEKVLHRWAGAVLIVKLEP